MHTADKQQDPDTQQKVLISYDTLRKLLGWLGISLPILLIAGSLALHGGILRSISAYYYSPMRDLLVGIFCSIGFFLFTYKGYTDRQVFISENAITNFAGVMAILVALLPTSFHGYRIDCVCTSNHIPCGWNVFGIVDNFQLDPESPQSKLLSNAHLLAAMLFFGPVAYLSIWRFTKIDDPGKDRRKEIRLYKICGWIIVGCIIVMALNALANQIWKYENVEITLHSFPVLFTFESIALFAFGIAWLTKGKLHQGIKRAAIAIKNKVRQPSINVLK